MVQWMIEEQKNIVVVTAHKKMLFFVCAKNLTGIKAVSFKIQLFNKKLNGGIIWRNGDIN